MHSGCKRLNGDFDKNTRKLLTKGFTWSKVYSLSMNLIQRKHLSLGLFHVFSLGQ